MLTQLTLRHFRCFDTLAVEFGSPTTFIVGANAQGKTSLLEAACILLRLQSPRVSTLARAVQHKRKGFVLDGYHTRHHMQFYFGKERKKLALDSVEQKTARQYLDIARVVYFGNQDIQIVRGPAEHRRKFLDFVAEQLDGTYRRHLRDYERALRCRNRLLKSPHPKWREVAAFDDPLIDAGNHIMQSRRNLIGSLQPESAEAQRAISGSAEMLGLEYVPGCEGTFSEALEASRNEDVRLHQTTVGPHRDDLHFLLNEQSSDFASEGQHRTLALSLKLGQASLLASQTGFAPLLLLDDIFGELDVQRRNALLRHLPLASQKLITTTHLAWMEDPIEGEVLALREGRLEKM